MAQRGVGVGLSNASVRLLTKNAVARTAGLFTMPDIDGGLIGGASLKADDFLAIAAAATSLV